MDAIEFLKKARDLWLEHPTKGWYAHDVYGCEVPAHSEEATCWCAAGALRKFGDVDKVGLFALSRAIAPAQEPNELVVANANDDGRLTREHWDTAIRNLGGEP